MLVLSRKIGESIIIGDNIEVKVLKIESGTVKIGIIAPTNVKIYRQEIYQTVAEQNKKTISEIVNSPDDLKHLKEVLKNVNKNRW